MARQILPIAGQIVGGMIGGPVGAAIGGAIGSAVGAYVDPIRHQGPKLGEARAQTAQEGVYRPVVFGTGCVSGNVIHRSPRKVVRHRERVGKGGRDTVDSDRGYRTFAIRIAEAHTPEGYTLLRIWENEKLVYDVRPESEIPEESAEYAEKFRFYAGTEDQLPDPDLEAYLGVGNVNAYRGSCYIVFGNFDLTDYSDMVPQYRFEVASKSEFAGAGNTLATIRPSGVGVCAASPDGIAWSEWISPAGSLFGNLIPTTNKFITYNTASPFRYTMDGGTTWSQSSGVDSGGSAGDLRGHCSKDGKTVLIAGGTQAVRRSMDGGLSFHLASSQQLNEVLKLGAGWVGRGFFAGEFFVTLNDGTSWTHTYTNNSISFVSCGWSDYETAMFGGRLGSSPAVVSTKNGATFQVESLPAFSSATQVEAIAEGRGRWVVGTDSGEFAWRMKEDSSWALSSVAMPVPVQDITYNGARFIAIGIEPGLSTSRRRVIMVSADGDNWQTVLDEEGNGIELRVKSLIGSTTTGVHGDRVPLSQVVGFCHRRSGMGESTYDATELSDLLDGVVFADGYTARDAITTLLPIYNADSSEHNRGNGYRINYIKRGAPVVRTLTVDDLVDEPEETVREDPLERPRVLHMAFESPVTGYTAAKASIQRLSPDVKLVNEVSTYVPVTFKDVNEAWQRADVQMRVAWTEVHGERTFSISDDQLDIVPTDVLALSLRGQLQRLRVLKVEYADGVLKLETVADRQSNYTSNVTGIPLPAPEKPPPSLMGPAAFAILDIPAISDQHDRLGYYVAVCGTTEAYAGAVIQRQQNGEWADVVRLGRSQRAIMGVLENTVSAASEHYTDTTNTVSVALYMDDELESLSDAQWLSEGGAFALETESGWEIMQYRDAYQDSEGVWHLTHLARGRLNTAPAEHLPGSRFVLLDGARFIDATVGMIGQPLTLRAAAVGRSPETAVPETITYQGNSQREFPVAHLFADLDGDDLSLQATPRDRFGTEDHPVRSINHDGFRWSATDGSSTVSLDTDHATATLDVSGLSTPITVTVAQINRFTGAGPTVSEQVE